MNNINVLRRWFMQLFIVNVKRLIDRFQQIQFSTILNQNIPAFVKSSDFFCHRHVNTIRKQMFLLSFLSLVFLSFLSYNFLATPSDIPIALVSYPGPTNQTRASRIAKEPFIFSKSQYLKQTHKVSLQFPLFSHTLVVLA